MKLAKCSLRIVRTSTIPSARRRVSCANRHVCFEDNGRFMCLYCSSDEGNTGFQPHGLTR